MQDQRRQPAVVGRGARPRARLAAVLVVATIAVLVPATSRPAAADGVAYRDLQNRITYPRTRPTTARPAIRGHAGADARIWAIAEQRGYRLRPVHVGARRSAAGVPLDVEAAGALELLIGDARRAGMTLGAGYGFRSVELQRTLFLRRIAGASNQAIAAGRADAVLIAALRWVAPPGYSKHHTGYAVDLRSSAGGGGAFGGSAVGRWLAANDYARAKARGWVPSYPPGAGAQGPEPEPWEYVYVGAAAIRCGHWLSQRNDRHGFDACRRRSAIDQKYLSLGGSGGVLGPLVEGERALPDGRGRRAQYRFGTIYWSASTGAHEVHGGLLSAYRRAGGAYGAGGYPISDAVTSRDGRWRYNTLERGRVYYDRHTGRSFWMVDPVFTKYQSKQGVVGPLGVVVGDPTRSSDGRSTPYQNFSKGRIYVLRGAAVEVHGAVYTWHQSASIGGARGRFGYPTADRRLVSAGVHEQRFEGGRVYYSAATGVRGLDGAVLDRYLAGGATSSELGLPLSTSAAVPGGRGRWARFQGGAIYALDGAAGLQVTGPVAAFYDSLGGPTGDLGYPVGELDAPGPAVRYQEFEHGTIQVDTATGAVTLVTEPPTP